MAGSAARNRNPPRSRQHRSCAGTHLTLLLMLLQGSRHLNSAEFHTKYIEAHAALRPQALGLFGASFASCRRFCRSKSMSFVGVHGLQAGVPCLGFQLDQPKHRILHDSFELAMCPRPLAVKWQKRILLLRLVAKGDDTEDGHLVLGLTLFWSSGGIGADTRAPSCRQKGHAAVWVPHRCSGGLEWAFGAGPWNHDSYDFMVKACAV